MYNESVTVDVQNHTKTTITRNEFFRFLVVGNVKVCYRHLQWQSMNENKQKWYEALY